MGLKRHFLSRWRRVRIFKIDTNHNVFQALENGGARFPNVFLLFCDAGYKSGTKGEVGKNERKKRKRLFYVFLPTPSRKIKIPPSSLENFGLFPPEKKNHSASRHCRGNRVF